MNTSELLVQCWNIHGIFCNLNGFTYNKLNDPEFLEHTSKYHIFGLIETHHISEDIDQLQLLGFKCFQTCRKKQKVGRKHGGLAVYVKENIIAGVQKVPTQGSETIVLKLKGDFFKLANDLYILFSYCVPSNSSFAVRTQFDPFSDLEQKIASLGSGSSLICLGDYNARTGDMLDFIENEDNYDITLPSNYVTDTVATYARGNMDNTVNKYGESLISLCKSVPLRICNGRKLGDVLGSFTCFNWNGQSAVDYCMATHEIYKNITTFRVSNLIPTLSDHCSISFSLRINTEIPKLIPSDYQFIDKPARVKWDRKVASNFENIIQSSESKLFVQNFLKNGMVSKQECIDNATDFLSDFIVTSAIQASHNGLMLKTDISKKNPEPNWKFRKKNKQRKKIYPKWHDETCLSLKKRINQSSYLLRKNPKNSFLRDSLRSETKQYKKLVKSKQREYINQLFVDLDNLHSSNPKGYMDLVKSLRGGSFDKAVSDDTSFVTPCKWQEHFQSLLAPPVQTSEAGAVNNMPGENIAATDSMTEDAMREFVNQNSDNFKTEIDVKFTRSEILDGISSLDNNKASSFDRITNEMLKTGKLILAAPLLQLFNSILSSTFYPLKWKSDILTPLHKSAEKNDPNNYRGVSVSSCLGKLFNKLLQNRLENLCNKNKYICESQGSGKKESRTSDHLLIVKFLVDKYVKQQKKQLFACFVDLRKAFDTVPRTKMFYSLLKDYQIGGNFLKILQEIYRGNQVYIKLSEGLLAPIKTSIGLKQGCVFSPILFNLFINKISGIFDETCSPVKINDKKLNSLLWADDLLIVSESPEGLQSAINKMHLFYQSLDLKINVKKTKVMIFNQRGRTLKNKYSFSVNNQKLEITDQYQYLGLKLRPSGSFNFSVKELYDKASRSWFSISNIIFQNKRMQVDRALGIFDSLVTPVATYGAPLWLPFILPQKNLKSAENILEFWDKMQLEKLNQKCCRTILSVNKKTSRLAVLGELARYPVFIPCLAQCLSYKISLEHRQVPGSLLGHVMTEMAQMAARGQDCWLTRVKNIGELFKIPRIYGPLKSMGKKLTNILRSKFDRFWVDKINESKIGLDNSDHNKLRTYKTFKASFTREPYLDLVQNRNQRSFLTRLRVSSHNLGIERGRHTRPITPVNLRICNYCKPLPATASSRPSSTRPRSSCPQIDTELHFLNQCPFFQNERKCVFEKISQIDTHFGQLNEQEMFCKLVCPISAQSAKLSNKLIKIMFESRNRIDLGQQINNFEA